MARHGSLRALPLPPNWSNQDLVLYHGTTRSDASLIVTAVNIASNRSRTDFGRGFYTTTNLAWAYNRAWQTSLRRPGSPAAVVELTLRRDDLAGLQCIWFVWGTPRAVDYWSLIGYCRSGGTAHARHVNDGWYDVAIGPVMRNERRRTVYEDYDQISFHTPAAEALLNASPRRILP